MKRQKSYQSVQSGDERIDRTIGDAIDAVVDESFEISNVAISRVEGGVLSAVYKVEVAFESRDSIKWILKICRSDLNIRSMFEKEKIFYSSFGPKMASDQLPFRIPKSISSSQEHILLEFIDNTTSYNLLGGFPDDKISFLIHAMACWHANGWDSMEDPSIRSLLEETILMNGSPPGIGQRLLPMQLEYVFASEWRNVLDAMKFGSDHGGLKEFAIKLCAEMEPLKLRLIHGMVHRQKVTFVHGDYHIANWLFPNDDSKPVLVDWTVWGYGNPMVDLGFFLVVGSNQQVISNHSYWLEQYLDSLTKYNPKINHADVRKLLPEWLAWALLCQWMVLVCFDEKCRGMAAAQSDESTRQALTEHFNRVNIRALLCLREAGCLELLKKIPRATTEEREEARKVSETAPLSLEDA